MMDEAACQTIIKWNGCRPEFAREENGWKNKEKSGEKKTSAEGDSFR